MSPFNSEPSPAKHLRQIIVVASPGLFLGVVFCMGTLCAESFLERTCRIESSQSKIILLIALILAAPFFMIVTRWSHPTGGSHQIGQSHRSHPTRVKWIIPGGILLAILIWSFLFRQVPAIAGTAGRTELSDQKEIQSTLGLIDKSRDITRTTSTFTHFADGTQVIETKVDTVFANGRISANPRITLSHLLNTGDFLKIAAIFFLMTLSLAIIFGPVAALLADRANARIDNTALFLPLWIGNGIAASLPPLIAALMTPNQSDNKLAGIWFPLGITAICFVIGALAIPSKGRKFAHVD
jgi:hypothetical protein